MYALEIRNLKKTYASGTQALKGINLQVREGDFFALLGPNGAGKTTTIGIISSLVTKTSGEILIFGHDIDKEPYVAKKYLGIMPQEFNFGMFEKVIDIVVNQAGFYGIPRHIILPRAEHYLTRLGLWDKRFAPARELSGGMKRRLMVARALVHDPKMLILDEPTAGVDIELRRSLWSFLVDINKEGTTIILTTHYLEEAESLCRGIAIIDKGMIVEKTTVKELLTRLNKEVVIFDLKQPLTEVPEFLDCNIKLLDEKTLEVTFSKAITLNDVFIALTTRGIAVTSMRNKVNRLEELFVNLTRRDE